MKSTEALQNNKRKLLAFCFVFFYLFQCKINNTQTLHLFIELLGLLSIHSTEEKRGNPIFLSFFQSQKKFIHFMSHRVVGLPYLNFEQL